MMYLCVVVVVVVSPGLFFFSDHEQPSLFSPNACLSVDVAAI